MKSRKQQSYKRKTFRNRRLNRKTRAKKQIRIRNKSRKMKGGWSYWPMMEKVEANIEKNNGKISSSDNNATQENDKVTQENDKATQENDKATQENNKEATQELLYILDNNNIKEIIEKGPDVNAKNKYDDTPLLLAIRNGNDEISELLIEKGAHFNAMGRRGDTPLLAATRMNNTNISILLIALISNKKFQDYLQGKPTIDALDKVDSTPLLNAIYVGNIDIVKSLIKNGANVNAIINDNGDIGHYPLLDAIKKGNNDIAKLLIEKGANDNTKLEKLSIEKEDE
jgi:cytohesin